MNAQDTTDKNYQDINRQGFVRRLPTSWQEYYVLARLDRPAGWHLLFVPCCFGLALALHVQPVSWLMIVKWFCLFLLGAIAMRSAGCIWNDILDRNIDKQVTRTKHRPIASGKISVTRALIYIGFWLMLALGVFINLPVTAQITTISIIPIVLIYPLMKRVFAMPQLILGLVFNWGILSAYSAVTDSFPTDAAWLLWLAGIFWTLSYDTIYACQDKDFDPAAQVKSMALLLRKHIKLGVGICYILFSYCYLLAFVMVDTHGITLALSIMATLLMLAKLLRLDLDNPQKCLQFFKHNGIFGFGCFMIAVLSLFIFSP